MSRKQWLFYVSYPLLTLVIFNFIGVFFELCLSIKSGLPNMVYDGLLFAIWFLRYMMPIIWVWQTLEIAYEWTSDYLRNQKEGRLNTQFLAQQHEKRKHVLQRVIGGVGRLITLFLVCQLLHTFELTTYSVISPYYLVNCYVTFMVLVVVGKFLNRLLRLVRNDESMKPLVMMSINVVITALVLQASSFIVQTQSEPYSYLQLLQWFGVLLFIKGIVKWWNRPIADLKLKGGISSI